MRKNDYQEHDPDGTLALNPVTSMTPEPPFIGRGKPIIVAALLALGLAANEEEVSYPAALLVGDLLRARLAKGAHP